MKKDTALRIVQLSDTHLFGNTQQKLLGLNTYESFSAVLRAVAKQQDSLDLLLVTGDLSHDGSKISYQRLADMVGMFNCPVLACPGNHDDAKMFKKAFKGHTVLTERALIIGNWQFILLNSQIPGRVEGYLPPQELNFLKKRLFAYPDHHTMVLFHHHPVFVGSKWLDQLGLRNSSELFNVVEKFKNIRAVVFGHAHQEFNGLYKQGIKLMGVPSTCIQFKRKSANFGLDLLPPGYRAFKLSQSGNIESKVWRSTNYDGFRSVEVKSPGY